MSGAGAPRPEVPSRVGAVGRAKDAADRGQLVMRSAMWLFVTSALQLGLAIERFNQRGTGELSTEDVARFVAGFVLLALAALALRAPLHAVVLALMLLIANKAATWMHDPDRVLQGLPIELLLFAVLLRALFAALAERRRDLARAARDTDA